MGAENFGYSRQLFKTGGQFESFKELGEPSQEHCFPSLRVSGGQRGAGGIQYMFKKMCGVIMYLDALISNLEVSSNCLNGMRIVC